MPFNTQTILAIIAIAAFGFAAYKWQQRKKVPDLGLNAFTQDITELARQGKLGQVVGMEESIDRIIHVIARKSKNNPLLIGEPGIGKTAAVEGLAQRIIAGDVPKQFKDKKVLALKLGVLMAGTKYRGELEERLRTLLDSFMERSREIILFIDEIHMIEQARGGEGSLDIADILKPALSRGDLQVIGATTWKEYLQYIKPDQAVDRRFQPVMMEEPSKEDTRRILDGVKASYEKFHGVCIPQETIKATVDAAAKFIKERHMPDKAFDVIDEACAKVSIEATTPRHGTAMGLIHAASAKAKLECGGTNPIVTPQDVMDVASEWKMKEK